MIHLRSFVPAVVAVVTVVTALYVFKREFFNGIYNLKDEFAKTRRRLTLATRLFLAIRTARRHLPPYQFRRHAVIARRLLNCSTGVTQHYECELRHYRRDLA